MSEPRDYEDQSENLEWLRVLKLDLFPRKINLHELSFENFDVSSGAMAKQTQENVSFPTVINVNVGGQMYTTSLSTLTKYSESMLGAMFSGRFAAQQDSNGNYFIDRDGALFRHVLAFLRNGELHVPENFNEFGLLLKEAEFYQIPALIQTVKQLMEGQSGRIGHKQDEAETITVFGIFSGYDKEKKREKYILSSLSGRLRTLTEMFHVADRKGDSFEITPYANQSDQTDNERMGKMTLKDEDGAAGIDAIFEVAQLHGFKETGTCNSSPNLSVYAGDRHWILSRTNKA